MNFRAIEGKPEGEGTLSGIMDVGGMVRDGEEALELGASSGVYFRGTVLIEVCVVSRGCAGNALESVRFVSIVECVPFGTRVVLHNACRDCTWCVSPQHRIWSQDAYLLPN